MEGYFHVMEARAAPDAPWRVVSGLLRWQRSADLMVRMYRRAHPHAEVRVVPAPLISEEARRALEVKRAEALERVRHQTARGWILDRKQGRIA
jgi:hypothetical protein